MSRGIFFGDQHFYFAEHYILTTMIFIKFKTTSKCIHTSHISFIPKGPSQFLLFFSPSSSFNQHPSIPLIQTLPALTKTDMRTQQSICIFFFLVSMYKISWKKASLVIALQQRNNRVIRQASFDLAGQLIHLPIYLNYSQSSKRETVYSSSIVPWQFHFSTPGKMLNVFSGLLHFSHLLSEWSFTLSW